MHWKNGLAQGFALFTHGEAARMAINSIHNLVFDDGAVRVTHSGLTVLAQHSPRISFICLMNNGVLVSVTALQTPPVTSGRQKYVPLNILLACGDIPDTNQASRLTHSLTVYFA